MSIIITGSVFLLGRHNIRKFYCLASRNNCWRFSLHEFHVVIRLSCVSNIQAKSISKTIFFFHTLTSTQKLPFLYIIYEHYGCVHHQPLLFHIPTNIIPKNDFLLLLLRNSLIINLKS